MGEITYKKKLQSFFSEFKYPLIIITLLALLSIYIHLYPFGSPMGQSEEIWMKRIKLHLEWGPFSHRLIQSYATLFFHHLFDVPIRESFFIVQYSLFFFIGLIFYRYLRLLSFDKLWSSFGLVLLLSAYPILGAHFSPVYTWDDLWGYLFVLLMIIYLLKNNWKYVGLNFLLGLFAREQIIIFLPVLLVMIYDQRKDNRSLNKIVLIVLPIIIYFLYRLFLWEDINPKRWELIYFNFATQNRSNDTLISLFLSFGFIWLLYFAGFIRLFYKKVLKEYRLLLVGSISTLILTIIIALFFAFTRETRILFPPFVFVIPIALIALKSITTFKYKSNWNCLKYILSAILLGFLIYSGISYVKYLDIQCDFWAGSDIKFLLTGIHFGVILFILYLYLIRILKILYNWGRLSFRTTLKKLGYMIIVISALSILFFAMNGLYEIINTPYSITTISKNKLFDDKIKIVNIKYEMIDNKPQAILFSFVALDSLSEDYRIYFHILQKGKVKMINLDFVPNPRVYNWNLNEVIVLRREIGLESSEYNCIVGFFNDNGRLGKPYKFNMTL